MLLFKIWILTAGIFLYLAACLRHRIKSRYGYVLPDGDVLLVIFIFLVISPMILYGLGSWLSSVIQSEPIVEQIRQIDAYSAGLLALSLDNRKKVAKAGIQKLLTHLPGSIIRAMYQGVPYGTKHSKYKFPEPESWKRSTLYSHYSQHSGLRKECVTVVLSHLDANSWATSVMSIFTYSNLGNDNIISLMKPPHGMSEYLDTLFDKEGIALALFSMPYRGEPHQRMIDQMLSRTEQDCLEMISNLWDKAGVNQSTVCQFLINTRRKELQLNCISHFCRRDNVRLYSFLRELMILDSNLVTELLGSLRSDSKESKKIISTAQKAYRSASWQKGISALSYFLSGIVVATLALVFDSVASASDSNTIYYIRYRRFKRRVSALEFDFGTFAPFILALIIIGGILFALFSLVAACVYIYRGLFGVVPGL